MIEIEGLTKYYKLTRRQQYALGAKFTRLKALDSVDLQCNIGEVLLILGTKNSGKSTLLHILSGLLPFDSGSVEVMGMDINKESAGIKEKTALIPSFPAYYEYLSVTEHLAYFAGLNQISQKTIKARLPDLLAQWKLENLLKTNVYRLSDEQRRYLSIAQSLLHDPQLLLLDEPTLGLDVFTAQPFVDLVNYAKAQGKTVVFTTNNISKAELLGDRLLILHQGKIIHQSNMENFRKMAGGNTTQAFLEIISNAGFPA